MFVDTGYKGNLDTTMLKMFSFKQFYLLQQNITDAVVSMVITDSSGEESNAYLYYRFDSTWKLNDMRTFKLYYIPNIKKALEKATQLQIDSAIAMANRNPHGNYLFRTQQEYKNKLNEYRFVCGTDSVFVEHFFQKETEFEKIKTSILQKLETEKSRYAIANGRDIYFSDSFKVQMHSLDVEEIQYEGDDDFPQCLDFRIIQMGDFSVGYIYVNDKKNIPRIKPSGLMMIRKIKNGWYLYRTN